MRAAAFVKERMSTTVDPPDITGGSTVLQFSSWCRESEARMDLTAPERVCPGIPQLYTSFRLTPLDVDDELLSADLRPRPLRPQVGWTTQM